MVSAISLETRVVPVVWVQARKRGETYCGRVVQLETFERAGECYQVETSTGKLWVSASNVRLCSGDGRCHCEAAA